MTTHHRDRLSNGYWFVAPYADLGAQNSCPNLCQVGPHIYDDYGELIWSGACVTKNRNSFDFKVWEQEGVRGLSFAIEGQSNSLDMWHKRGAGLLMNDSYSFVDSVDPADESSQFNFHEFTKLQDPRGTLMLYDGSSNVTDEQKNQELLVWDGGFTELDPNGQVVFRWRALDYIDIAESTAIKPEAASTGTEWDWFHANSVEKNEHGDYILSARHTDCIYKISAVNGSIIWRMGGTDSTLDLQGFNFSRQHDARFMTSNTHTGAKEVISFLNNAGDSHGHTSDVSAAHLVEIDTDQQTARLLKQWQRPNGKLGTYRGNVQFLENGNVFVHWGDNGHITEFDDQGVVLQEARFVPTHLGTYRAYKFDFTGKPSEPIVLKCSAHNVLQDVDMTVCYVSWNGATEITHWEISESKAMPSLAGASKTGFETALIIPVWYGQLVARGLAANGTVLGVSKPYTVDRPNGRSPSALQDGGTFSDGRNKVDRFTTNHFAWMALTYVLSVVTLAQLFARYYPQWLIWPAKRKERHIG